MYLLIIQKRLWVKVEGLKSCENCGNFLELVVVGVGAERAPVADQPGRHFGQQVLISALVGITEQKVKTGNDQNPFVVEK